MYWSSTIVLSLGDDLSVLPLFLVSLYSVSSKHCQTFLVVQKSLESICVLPGSSGIQADALSEPQLPVIVLLGLID